VQRNVCPVLGESFPILYRFESAAALYRHLESSGFFLADPFLPWSSGTRVIVELDAGVGQARSLLRARLAGRERDGVWLDLAASHTTAWWNSAACLHRRERRRLGCDLFCEVRPAHGAPWFCRAVDLSEGGARIDTGPFQSLLPGDRVEVTLLSADPMLRPAELPARVAWAWGREAGLAFDESGVELRGLVAAVEWRWDEARRIEHGPRCHCGLRAGGQRQPYSRL
jgi:PilZ domain